MGSGNDLCEERGERFDILIDGEALCKRGLSKVKMPVSTRYPVSNNTTRLWLLLDRKSVV